MRTRSRLMSADEEGTLERLKALRRELIDPTIKEHRGRIVKATGDGMLVVFASVVDALRCAVDIQREMVGVASLPEIALQVAPGGEAGPFGSVQQRCIRSRTHRNGVALRGRCAGDEILRQQRNGQKASIGKGEHPGRIPRRSFQVFQHPADAKIGRLRT